MSHLLITIFLLAVGWQVTSLLVGLSPTIWRIYTQIVPSQASIDAQALRLQQTEVLKIRKEMATTSSQDEFAKWAKLRREHDKKVAELEKLSETVATQSARFKQVVSTARWILFSALGFFIQLWHRKEPVFWLPRGLLPDYVEWGLCFPQAPRGSVSVNIWSACTAVMAGLISAWLKPTTPAASRVM
ncbi:GET complex subunit get1 [Orbilia blumenaviensis]|uniref:GET complex subunit get1 n=1 Tax=Orbilia blumenaviensis TaxID=1796055 RepID=A0AAV9U282_9PEZI